ncbi:unnamed protein product [[Actinomadura] parvosata subsp. kistnae]|nr:unnamed protein product [Actinomadura parvosata subsp. kistnae]
MRIVAIRFSRVDAFSTDRRPPTADRRPPTTDRRPPHIRDRAGPRTRDRPGEMPGRIRRGRTGRRS